jgi:sterol desaturase/sphingolipid hydroxylase (fatty acid hydroxylase superfamily)
MLAVAAKALLAYAFLAAFMCLLVASELAFPRGEMLPLRERFRMILFSAVYILGATALSLLMARAHIWHGAPISGWPALIVAVIVGDFLYYWYHRAQHTFAWMWRYHSVHHSTEELGAGAGYHHWLEIFGLALFVSVPLSFVVSKPEAPLLTFLLSMHGFYIHSASRINFGRFVWVAADNRMHRIHHSIEPRHANRNFGRYTMIWDYLFRTAHNPRGEWPRVGIIGQPEPRTLRAYLSLPSSPEMPRSEQSSDRGQPASSSEFA